MVNRYKFAVSAVRDAPPLIDESGPFPHPQRAMTPPIRDSYLTASVESNARVFAHLLQELPADSPRWDAKPDADRFPCAKCSALSRLRRDFARTF
jgi:hypothetical protein